MAERLRHPAAPLLMLAVLSCVSLCARAAWLGEPCRAPCRGAAAHLLVFDETYYVNAARVIAGIHPPAREPYANAPLGDDPNSEHPQLAKLLISGSIRLFGDGPLGWRLPSLLAGTVAILAVFALARALGTSRWLAVAGSAVAAADNLLSVHGRIATLDVFCVATMLVAAALYLRGGSLRAGLLAALAICFKEVGVLLVTVLWIYEVLGRGHGGDGRGSRLRAGKRLAWLSVSAALATVGLLAVLDRIVPPYDASAHRLVAGGAPGHIEHVLSYGARLSSPHGPSGIASYPWGWLVDVKPIVYLNVVPDRPAAGLAGVHPAAHFLGMISPPILLLALPALVMSAGALVRAAYRRAKLVTRSSPAVDQQPLTELAAFGLAWFGGTFVPFLLLSALADRTSYIYYMVIVMPGLYLLVVATLRRCARRWRRLALLWAILLVAAAVLMYPFTPLP